VTTAPSIDLPGRVENGHGFDELDAAVEATTLRAIARSSCKLMMRDGDGQHVERLYPGCDGVARFPATHCHMHLERVSPELRRELLPDALRGVTIDRVNAYISPAGAGAALHFDIRTVVIVQLVGAKVWEVSRRPAVATPTVNCVAPTDRRRFEYDGRTITVPDELVHHELSPGDWLVVPKGTWHRTSTTTGSVSVTLALPA